MSKYDPLVFRDLLEKPEYAEFFKAIRTARNEALKNNVPRELVYWGVAWDHKAAMLDHVQRVLEM